MTFKKIIGFTHLWLGLISGIIVFLVSITGCIYVFVDELKPVVYYDRIHADEVGEERLPLSELLKVAMDSAGDKENFRISIYNAADKNYTFEYREMNKDTCGIWYWHEKNDGWVGNYTGYINPYTGTIETIKCSTFDFFYFVLWIHWSLLLKSQIGQPVVGTATLIFVILLISGLVLWWPKNKSAAKQRFWFRWKDTTRWKRKNYDLHNIAGFYMMIFALLIALTGLVWAFEWFDKSVQWVANAGQTFDRKQEQPIHSDTSRYTVNKPYEQTIAHAQNSYPHALSYHIYFPHDSLSPQQIYVLNDENDRRENVSLAYDQYTGALLKTYRYNDNWENMSNGDIVRSLNYDIHVGRIWGLPGKILAFLASLVSASLPVTGFVIWWGRRSKDREKREKNQVQVRPRQLIKKSTY